VVKAITDENKINSYPPEDAWDFQEILLWTEITQMCPTNFKKA
jgi:hypothetical protein